MSGFDATTGWTHFTPKKLSRYLCVVEGQPDAVEERLEDQGLRYYWDAHGGLHVQCTEGVLWELLSGQPDTRSVDQAGDSSPTPEWISISDLGAIWDPPLATSSVLKLLREEGLLRRVEGRDEPTESAVGLYDERSVVPSGRFDSAGGVIQRRWSYGVLLRLRLRRIEVQEARGSQSPPKPKKPPRVVLRWAATCARCSTEIATGTEANWNPDTRGVTCVDC